MPTYIYLCETHGEFEAVHSITEQLMECSLCKETGVTSKPPKRLIASTSFVLVGGGWAKDNYK
jgi:putative FmdB family regulatory protein